MNDGGDACYDFLAGGSGEVIETDQEFYCFIVSLFFHITIFFWTGTVIPSTKIKRRRSSTN